MKMHLTTETQTNRFINFSLHLQHLIYPTKTHRSVFSSFVSTLTISTTGVNKLPLLQAALVAIFQEVQCIVSRLFL